MIKKIMVCDFCGKDISEVSDFPEITIDLDCGREYHLDLCYDCYQELVAYIDKRIGTDKSQIDNTAVKSCSYSENPTTTPKTVWEPQFDADRG